MSLTIIKAGILDTIQDAGRYGYQHLGINPSGAMDRFSAQLSNCLLGKEMHLPVIEMHFPASTILFNEATVICIAGANFSPAIDNTNIPLHQPVAVNKNARLRFKKANDGMRCYLSLLHGLHLPQWLNSYNTHLKAQAGGFEGRALKNGDTIAFEKNPTSAQVPSAGKPFIFPWHARPVGQTAIGKVEVIEGKEWDWLTEDSKEVFKSTSFSISTVADRMGYRLQGTPLILKEQKQLVSAGVNFGTIQLLPNGQLIVLMADHQTTGGYPVIANVVSSHLPALAQMQPKHALAFHLTDNSKAEQKLLQQRRYLLSVQYASSYKITNLLS